MHNNIIYVYNYDVIFWFTHCICTQCVSCPISNAVVNFPINQGATILRTLQTLLHVAVQRNITDAHSARKDARAGEEWKSHDVLRRSGRHKILPDKLCRKFSALHKCILSRDSRRLFICYPFFLSFRHFLTRSFIPSSRLFLVFSMSPFIWSSIITSSQVIRIAAFNKIELSFCGWYF